MKPSARKYAKQNHPITGDLMWKCAYIPESISLVEKFIKENFHKEYTLSICDTITNNTLEITNPVEEIVNEITSIIGFVSSAEHSFVRYIGINSLSNSYVVGMDFTRGNIDIPAFYRNENGKLVPIPK